VTTQLQLINIIIK